MKQITDNYTCVDFLNEQYDLAIKYQKTFNAEEVEQFAKDNNLVKVDKPDKGDLVVFYMLEIFHVGIMLDDTRFIHLQENVGVVTNILDKKWRRRLYASYRRLKE
jgi:cell wall-associated NlpC family hydrolase